MEYLIGIDIGTTNIKVLVIDRAGHQIALVKRASPFVTFGAHQVYRAEDLWENVTRALQSAVAEMHKVNASPSNIRGIAVSSMGEMGFPVGKEDALYPAIAWFDQCSVPYLERLGRSLPVKEQLEHVGQRLIHIFTISKLMWLKETHPEIYDQMETWLCIADYVAFKLCGSRCMDMALAARTGMLDLKKQGWSAYVMEKAGLDIEKMPKLVQCGDLLGVLGRKAAEETGLPEGVPVLAGGHDHVCASFACGGGTPGILMDSSGTSEVLVVAEDNLARLTEAGRRGFNIGSHAKPNTYYIMGGILAAGASVDQFRREFGSPSIETPNIGSLIYLPHLRGSSSPTRDPNSKGAFLGIKDTHTKADFLQSVYEGLAFELRLTAESITNGALPQKIIGVGGGYLNDDQSQMKADILSTEIEVPVIQEGTAMGAALLAGIGSGVFASASEAYKETFRSGKRFEARRTLTDYYEEKFAIYRTLYQELIMTNTALSKLN